MPRFMPVQCHKCSVLQIKPAQKPGLKWCCSMCRKVPEVTAAAATAAAATAGAQACASHVDVSLFVEEMNLESQEAEEMGAVANTFRGVESLDGASIWEGLYYQSSKVQHHHHHQRRVNPIQIYEDDFPRAGEVEEKSWSKSNWEMGQKRGGCEQRQFLSSLWGRWHQKAAKKDVVELMEFAGGVGNEENVPPGS